MSGIHIYTYTQVLKKNVSTPENAFKSFSSFIFPISFKIFAFCCFCGYSSQTWRLLSPTVIRSFWENFVEKFFMVLPNLSSGLMLIKKNFIPYITSQTGKNTDWQPKTHVPVLEQDLIQGLENPSTGWEIQLAATNLKA
jgi:hypothetical protein